MSIIDRAVKTIGLRQRSYQSLFAEGSRGHHVLTEIALYSMAFDADADGLSRDTVMTMHGRRQMFFHIVNHLKLSPMELESIYITVAPRSAARFRLVLCGGRRRPAQESRQYSRGPAYGEAAGLAELNAEYTAISTGIQTQQADHSAASGRRRLVRLRVAVVRHPQSCAHLHSRVRSTGRSSSSKASLPRLAIPSRPTPTG